MAFFTFYQNNSGGVLIGPAKFVIVAADNADQANDTAQDHGIYFDGCSSGIDCDCCGDRWHRASDYNATDTPMIYGTNPEDYKHWDNDTKIPVYIFVKKGLE
jgi:hypothetical protein